MSLLDVLETTLVASLGFSWVGALIALLPAWIACANSPMMRRRHYFIAGLLGGVAGEFSGVASLFLSLWIGCLGQGSYCNTAQGDMGLIVTVPVGSLAGTLIALLWTWITLRIPEESAWTSVCSYSGSRRIRNWACATVLPVIFWGLLILFFARLMA
jgi:hypothetical protein